MRVDISLVPSGHVSWEAALSPLEISTLFPRKLVPIFFRNPIGLHHGRRVEFFAGPTRRNDSFMFQVSPQKGAYG